MGTIVVEINNLAIVPWKSPTCMGKYKAVSNKSMKIYKTALVDHLERAKISLESEGPYELEIWIWRSLSNGARRADATNMLKSTEDAIQLAFGYDDKLNLRVTANIVEQRAKAPSRLVFRLSEFAPVDPPQTFSHSLGNELSNSTSNKFQGESF